MRTEDLLEVIGDVDDELLERSEKAAFKTKNTWKRWIPLAACACFLLVIGVRAIGGGFDHKLMGAAESIDAPAEDKVAESFANKDACPEEEEAPMESEPESVSENPFADVDIVNGSLALFKYDGEEITCYRMYDNSKMSSIFDTLSALNYMTTGSFKQQDISCPVYGFEAYTSEGRTLHVAWSSSCWIESDGDVWTAEFDPRVLETRYEWDSVETYTSLTAFPCARQLCQRENGWDTAFMSPAEELTASGQVELEITSQDTKKLQVCIQNNSREDWVFGEYYSVQVCVEDVWYVVPTLDTDHAFWDIASILPADESVERTYDLEPYGVLPTGTYRLVVEELTVEFEIE